MKNTILIFSCLILFCCRTKEQKIDFSVFDHMRDGYNTMAFISSSKSIDLEDEIFSSIEAKLLNVEYDLVDNGAIPIANNFVPLVPNSKYFKHRTKDNSVLMERVSEESKLHERWKDIYNSIETYSGIQNGHKGKYYLKLEEAKPLSLNATFKSDHYIFNIREELSFSNTKPGTWKKSEFDEYTNTINSLNKKLDMLLEHIIMKSELVYRPLNGRQLSSEERLFGFVKFWTEVKYNFAFFDQVPELNWDNVLMEYLPKVQAEQGITEYFNLLSEVCALLEDGHTNIYPPPEAYLNTANLPFKLKKFDDGIYLVNFDKKYDSKLELGLKLITIDNIPVNEHIDKTLLYISASTDYIRRRDAIDKILQGESGSIAELEFRDSDDNIININCERANGNVEWQITSPPFELVRLKNKDGIGILEINSFGSQKVVESFESYLDDLTSLDNLIIDLRKNGGGNSNHAYDILDYFSSQPIITSKWKTREHKPAFMAWGNFVTTKSEDLSDWEREALETSRGEYWYESPPDTIKSSNDRLSHLNVVLLIGNSTASAAEDFLIAAESVSLGQTVGDYTFGSTGQPLSIKLPGGASARICTKRDIYPNGKEFVGYGIQPDHIVKESIADIKSGKDVALEAAVKLLVLQD